MQSKKVLRTFISLNRRVRDFESGTHEPCGRLGSRQSFVLRTSARIASKRVRSRSCSRQTTRRPRKWRASPQSTEFAFRMRPIRMRCETGNSCQKFSRFFLRALKAEFCSPTHSVFAERYRLGLPPEAPMLGSGLRPTILGHQSLRQIPLFRSDLRPNKCSRRPHKRTQHGTQLRED